MPNKPSYDELAKRVAELEKAAIDRELTERAERKSADKFRLLTTLSPGGIYQTDKIGDCVFANASWLRMAGMTFAEAEGRGWVNAVHPEDREAVEQAWYKMVASAGRWGHEYRMKSPQGKITWVYGLATPMYDDEGDISGYLGLNIDISDRKAAERALRSSNSRYQTLFQDAPIPLWEEDFSEVFSFLEEQRARGVRDFRQFFDDHSSHVLDCARMVKIIDVNVATLKLHRAKNKADLLGHLDNLFTERSFDIFKEELIALAAGEREFESEGEVKTLDGEILFIYLKLIIDKDRSERPIALLATIDITKRRRMEEALEQSQAQLHAFLNNSPVGFGLWDRRYRYVYLNEELQKMNGPSIEEHIGKTIEEMLPKAAPIIMPLFEKIFSTSQPLLNMELSGELPSTPGDITHYLASYFPISVIEGTPQFIGGVVVEITDRVQAEAALRKSEEKYRTLIELAQEGIWAINKDNETTFVNPSMAKMLGYTPQEMKNKHLFKFMDEQGIEIAKKNLERRAKGIKEQHDFEFVRKNGQRIFTTIETAPILDKNGNYNGALAGVIDITERKKSEADKRKLQARLAQAQKMETIGTLAGGIAHDFNNILTSILGFTELTLDDVEKGSLSENNLQEVYAAGKRAKDIVKQILTFARQTKEDIKPIAVNVIVKEVLTLIRASIPTTIGIEDRIKSKSLIMGSPSQVHQILMNLCSNASQAMDREGGVLTVTLQDILVDKGHPAEKLNLRHGDYIELKVSDTGVGIPPEIIHSIFEPYFTTKDPGEGTGMGLAMVSGIVESYGGKITVDSHVGQGSLFTTYLPITRKHQVYSPYQSETLPKGDERVLFVDDEPAIAKMGGRILERLGYTVETTTNSADALELFRSKPNDFDLVITDMTMPDITGDTLASALMKIRPDIPVVLCTGHSKKISTASARQIGIKAFVHKPIMKADFAKIIRNVLDADNSFED